MTRKKSIPKPDLAAKLCEQCGRPFTPLKYWQKYCDQSCNQAAYYERQIKKKRGTDAIDVLDASPPSGPTSTQEAEWKRRTDAELINAQQTKEQTDKEEKEKSRKLSDENENIYLKPTLADVFILKGGDKE